MKKTLLSIIIAGFTITSYANESDVTAQCSPTANRTDIQQSIKWYRDSAEKTALYNQTFNLASQYVKNWVETNHPKAKTWGVVLDIDETTLDNSWYFIRCADLADNESDFEHFVTIPQKSIALPGVANFTYLVHKLGGYVSMVSNRDGSYKDTTGNSLDATVANLKQQQIYFDQVVLGNYRDSSQPTNKNPRFNSVISGKYDATKMVWSNKLPAHHVIAFFGDNIQDFPVFKQSEIYKLAPENSTYNKFGNGYFILPNPMYGSWENNQYK